MKISHLKFWHVYKLDIRQSHSCILDNSKVIQHLPIIKQGNSIWSIYYKLYHFGSIKFLQNTDVPHAYWYTLYTIIFVLISRDISQKINPRSAKSKQ